MPNSKATIAVDAMGGDNGPSAIVPGAVEAARKMGISLLLVGDEATIQAELDKLDTTGINIEIAHATQVAEMGERPSEVLRRKKDSSIQVACQMVREGKAHGVVSAGNSGATVACGMFILGRIQGVERPGLASIMPTEKSPMVLIDVGANVDSKPYHLFQFGIMADVFARDVLGIKEPGLGLLSIGEEEGKGNVLVKESFELFKMASLNFVGNVEGRDIFTGGVDIVVCDGFVGNVALKLSEGLGASLARIFKSKLGKLKIDPSLLSGAQDSFDRFVDYAEYGGAPLLGLRNIVIICHGSSNSKAVSNAVRMAAKFVIEESNEHLMTELVANEELTRFGKAAMKQ